MRAKCLSTTAARLSPAHIEFGYTPMTIFDLAVGEIYTVHGICWWKGLVMYLLDSHAPSRPKWYPATLFQITDDQLPSRWHFAHWNDESYEVRSLCGYEELVREESHFDRLAEEDPEAIRVFVRRREEAQIDPGRQ